LPGAERIDAVAPSSSEPVGSGADSAVSAEPERTMPAEGNDAAVGAPGVEAPSQPAFLRESTPPKGRVPRALLGAAAAVLGLLALAQVIVAFRAEILAQYPQARPALGQLCKVFNCTVGWPTRADQLAVIGTELQSLPGTSAFELTTVVRNRGSVTLALPAIELTLSDTLNRTVARKVFVPADYLAGESDPQAQMDAGLQAGADLTIRIAFEASGINAAGFVVYPFYL
jgi:hypothetical protein